MKKKVVIFYFDSPETDISAKIDNKNYEPIFVNASGDIEKILSAKIPDIILIKLKGNKERFLKLIERIKNYNENIPIVVIGPSGDTRLIVECIKKGVFDYIPEPYRQSELNIILKTAGKVEKHRVITFNKEILTDEEIRRFFGVSKKIQSVLEQVKLVASTDMCVILQGESGTGKEMIANLIHSLSLRKNENFIPIDCGALPESLLESELFGYERGAFTGAYTEKPGMIELADKGTLFLDEIGNLSLMNQTKLLRFLEDKKIQRLGGRVKKFADVRIIAATNIDLQESVKKREFRLDLYHRLSEFLIKLPSLRERKEDIPILSDCFLIEAEKKLKKKIKGILPQAMELMIDYNWPGNVRELKHVIISSALRAKDYIGPEHLEFNSVKTEEKDLSFDSEANIDFYNTDFSLKNVVKKAVADIEKKYIIMALKETKGNRAKAARILKIDRSALYQKIKSYKINV